jgi:hypothetical protein
MSKPIKILNDKDKQKILDKFCKYLASKGHIKIIFQSIPSQGLWTNEGFYSLENIVAALNLTGKLKHEIKL